MKFIMSTLGIISGLSVGVIGFLFLVWRRLKEDYSSQEIFPFAFVFIFFVVIGFFVGLFGGERLGASNVFNPQGLWFWTSILFGGFGFGIAFLKFRLRFYEVLQAVIQGLLFWYFTIFINFSVPIAIFIIALVFSFKILDERYRSFTWYKSGKVGFSGLFILGVFFLVRVVVALINPNMVSFVGRFDAILSIIATFLSFVTLYNLSGL